MKKLLLIAAVIAVLLSCAKGDQEEAVFDKGTKSDQTLTFVLTGGLSSGIVRDPLTGIATGYASSYQVHCEPALPFGIYYIDIPICAAINGQSVRMVRLEGGEQYSEVVPMETFSASPQLNYPHMCVRAVQVVGNILGENFVFTGGDMYCTCGDCVRLLNPPVSPTKGTISFVLENNNNTWDLVASAPPASSLSIECSFHVTGDRTITFPTGTTRVSTGISDWDAYILSISLTEDEFYFYCYY